MLVLHLLCAQLLQISRKQRSLFYPELKEMQTFNQKSWNDFIFSDSHAPLSWSAFCCCDKHHSNSGAKGCFHLSGYSLWSTEAEAQAWCRNHAQLLPFVLHSSGSPIPGMAPTTVGLAPQTWVHSQESVPQTHLQASLKEAVPQLRIPLPSYV